MFRLRGAPVLVADEWRTVAKGWQPGFPDVGLQGFAPKVLAHGHRGGNRHWQVELQPVDDPRYFQISVPMQLGNSGGALVDERGIVVGQAGCISGCLGTGELIHNIADLEKIHPPIYS
jgi:hypothetical protein